MLELEISDPRALKLTDSSGESFVKVGNYLKKVTVAVEDLESSVTVTPHFYLYTLVGGTDTKADEGKVYYSRTGDKGSRVFTKETVAVGTTDVSAFYTRDDATQDQLKGVGGGTYSFVITATGRTRIANNVTTFHATNVSTAGYGYEGKISGKVVLAGAGTFTIETLAYTGSGNQTAVGGAQKAGSTISVKYSIGGEATDANRSDNDEYDTAEDGANSVTGGFSIAF